MYQPKRPLSRPIIIVLIAASFLLAACGAEVASQNWPGIVANGNEVFIAYGPGVASVDVETRQLQWTFPDESNPALLFFAEPSVSEDLIVFGDFGMSGGMFSPQATVTLYALDRPDGGEAPPPVFWTRDDVASDRIIAPALQDDGQIFVGTADNHVYALDAESGELQWDFPTDHSIWAQPVVNGDLVYVASLDNNVYALDRFSGEVSWQVTLGGSVASHPVLSDGLLYVPSFDRQLHALDAESGDVVWTADASNWVWGSPAVGNGTVYFGDIDGNVYAVSAETGEPQWTATADGAVQSALLYEEGVVYVTAGETEGDEDERRGQIMALDAESGDILWQREADAPVFSTPVLVGDSLVIVFQTEQSADMNVFNRDDGALTWEFTLPAEL
ncbi:MAG: PQQ-binding-like beta-propeller repeat protein [Chloroflexota bacterium]